MVHCITLAVPVKGLRFAKALDWYSQGDTVDHINQRSVLSIYFLCLFDLRPDFMIWLIRAYFGHDHPYYINDYKRPIRDRNIKQRAKENLASGENVTTIFMFVG